MEASPAAPDAADGGRLRVLMISRDFPPVSHSGTLRCEAFAKYLPDFGVDPVIFTSRPQSSLKLVGLNSAVNQGWVDDTRWPAVRRVDWQMDASPVPRVASFLRRIPVVNNTQSQGERLRLVERLVPELRTCIREHLVDVIFASAMPSETLLLATAFKDQCGLPVIGDLRDPWSYQPILPYRSILDFYLERRLERRTLMKCDKVVVNARQTQVLLEEELKIPGERIAPIRNGFDEDDFSSTAESPSALDPGRFVILHAGQLANDVESTRAIRKRVKQALGLDYDPLHVEAESRSPKYLLRALEQVLRSHPEMIEKIRLWLVGIDEQQALRISADVRLSAMCQDGGTSRRGQGQRHDLASRFTVVAAVRVLPARARLLCRDPGETILVPACREAYSGVCATLRDRRIGAGVSCRASGWAARC